jgi:hypothetical protein
MEESFGNPHNKGLLPRIFFKLSKLSSKTKHNNPIRINKMENENPIENGEDMKRYFIKKDNQLKKKKKVQHQ